MAAFRVSSHRHSIFPSLTVGRDGYDNFITDLFCLAEHCLYGELCNEMIRDRLVVGLLDTSLSEKMQLDSDLTLSKVLATARQTEAARQQLSVVRGMLQ